MLVAEFNKWFKDFSSRYPTVAEYSSRQENSKLLLDTWHKTLAAFAVETLYEVTDGIIAGDLDAVPNTALGQFANEIRMRAKLVLERKRRDEPQDWQQVPLLGTMLKQPKMAWMLRCAKAVDKLLGVTTADGYKKYAMANSVRAQDGSYDAAIIMADDHTAYEEKACLEAFARDGLTWEQIQDVARMSSAAEIIERVEDESYV